MEISRREFVLSAFTLSLISIYPKLSYACDISSVFDKMNPTTKIALGLVTVAAIYLVPQMWLLLLVLLHTPYHNFRDLKI